MFIVESTVYLVTLILIILVSAAWQSRGNGGNLNLNVLTIQIDNHVEDKSVTTGNSAKLEHNVEEVRAIE